MGFLDQEAFAKVPDVPPFPFKASGIMLDLVNMREGVVTGTPGFDKIRALPSFVSLESGLKVGMHVERTVDMFTSPGGVVLINKDEAALQRDVAVIRQMETDCALLQYQEHGEILARPRMKSGSTIRAHSGSLQISEKAAVGWTVVLFCVGALAGAALSH